jgi:hypothetical protein
MKPLFAAVDYDIFYCHLGISWTHVLSAKYPFPQYLPFYSRHRMEGVRGRPGRCFRREQSSKLGPISMGTAWPFYIVSHSNVQRVALTGQRCNIYIQYDLHPILSARTSHAPSCHEVTQQRRGLNQ